LLCHSGDASMMPLSPDDTIADGDVLPVGSASVEAIHLVGHTPGGIAFLYDEAEAPHLFSGDCLFPGGPGNTQGDAARFASLMHDLESKVFDRLPDDTWVYPGHGKDTTLGTERPAIPEWHARGW
jgi:glyoxylase-like metal-dependent hydrolase (beta-lactamase superfamily II)